MSIEYCHKHDRPVDTDFETNGCVKCERDPSFDDDVALAESAFPDLPEPFVAGAHSSEMLDEVLS